MTSRVQPYRMLRGGVGRFLGWHVLLASSLAGLAAAQPMAGPENFFSYRSGQTYEPEDRLPITCWSYPGGAYFFLGGGRFVENSNQGQPLDFQLAGQDGAFLYIKHTGGPLVVALPLRGRDCFFASGEPPRWQYRAAVNRIKQNIRITINMPRFHAFSAPNDQGYQRTSVWCWAACMQMVVNFHGIMIAQEQFVERIWGSPDAAMGGSVDDILRALNAWSWDTNGRRVFMRAQPVIRSFKELVRLVGMNFPLIMGMDNPGMPTGHCLVVVGAEYHIDVDANEMVPVRLLLQDPAPPGYEKQQSCTWDEGVSRNMEFIRVWTEYL